MSDHSHEGGADIRTLILYLRNGMVIQTAVEGNVEIVPSTEQVGRLHSLNYSRPTRDGLLWADPGEICGVELVSGDLGQPAGVPAATVAAPPQRPQFIGQPDEPCKSDCIVCQTGHCRQDCPTGCHQPESEDLRGIGQ